MEKCNSLCNDIVATGDNLLARLEVAEELHGLHSGYHFILLNISRNFVDGSSGYLFEAAAVPTLSPRLWMTGWCCTTTTALTAPSSSLLTPHCNMETWRLKLYTQFSLVV